MPQLTFAVGGKALGPYLARPPAAAVPSADGKALLVPVELDADKADEVLGDSSVLFEGAAALRASAKQTLAPSGLSVYVTGPGGTLADFVTAFGGIDGILLGVALGVVFLILLIVYRSPILPFAVLLTAVFGLAAAALVIFPLARNGTIAINGQSQGILSILVVGAATDYALLLVARYREELHDHPSKWQAMRVAWRAAVEPIGASAATVILGLLCLLLSQLGNTRGLGPVGAIGIAGAVVAALTFLPAVLLLVGRRVFWPLVPRVDHAHAEDAVGSRGVWGRVAGMVGRHPRRTWVVTLLALLVLGGFVPTFRADGVTQSQLFLDKVESVTGQEVLARHFPAGSGSPVEIVVDRDRADAVVATVKRDVDVSEAAVVSAGARGPADGRRRQGAGAGHPAPGGRQPGRRGGRHPAAERARHRRHGRAGRRQHGLQPRRQAGQRARPAGDHPGDPAGHPGGADAAAALGGGPGAADPRQRRLVRRDAGGRGARVQPRLRLPGVATPPRRSTRSCSSSRWASTTRSS